MPRWLASVVLVGCAWALWQQDGIAMFCGRTGSCQSAGFHRVGPETWGTTQHFTDTQEACEAFKKAAMAQLARDNDEHKAKADPETGTYVQTSSEYKCLPLGYKPWEAR
jgi:hypothetical protein